MFNIKMLAEGATNTLPNGDYFPMTTSIISVADLSVKADIFYTSTGQAIVKALPLEGTANFWGDEIYFDIPVVLEQEPDARVEVAVGDLGYWPAGSAFCIFFGPTPMSRGREPRAYSPVNVFGRILGDATVFKTVEDGALIRIDRA
jgi:hypothetical protein